MIRLYLLFVPFVLFVVNSASAREFYADHVTDAAGAPLTNLVRYAWVVDGQDAGTSAAPRRADIPDAARTVQLFAEFGTEITDADGIRIVWERDPIGTNIVRINRPASIWNWIRKLFVR